MITHRLDPQKIRETVGLRLHEIRLEQNLSLEQVCRDNRLHLQELWRIEDGRGYSYCFFRRLLQYYNKRIEINVVD